MLTVCVLASGPSLCPKDAEIISRWRNGVDKKTIAINNCYKMLPVSDWIYACDLRWWNRYHDEVSSICSGEFWAYDEKACQQYQLNRANLKHTGGNGGYQAIRLAITEFGAERIVMTGYDMQGTHWHGQHEGGFPNPDEKNFIQWIGWLRKLVHEFSEVEFINATRETAIPAESIPCMRLEDALSDCMATV